ncbi:colicin E3/pyocin S6 family cytotoxin [Streptomyces sp. SGAir0957]
MIIGGAAVCATGVGCFGGAVAITGGIAVGGAGVGIVSHGVGQFNDGLNVALRNARDKQAAASRPPASGPIKAPKQLDAFPEAKPAKPKTPVQGGGGFRARWKDSKGKIYEWDSQHGRVEVYSKTGKKHLGEFDPKTGSQTKPGDSSRKVEK